MFKLRFVALLIGFVALSGCATGDREADAFFNRGWLWPKSLDEPREPPPPTDDLAQARD